MEARINRLLDAVPALDAPANGPLRRVTHASRTSLRPPDPAETILVVDATGHPPEGRDAVCQTVVSAAREGWRRIVLYRTRGDRFIGCGLGPASHGIRVDVYGSSGDYLGSGLDGAEIHVHGSAQDQVGQILKDGKIALGCGLGQLRKRAVVAAVAAQVGQRDENVSAHRNDVAVRATLALACRVENGFEDFAVR